MSPSSMRACFKVLLSEVAVRSRMLARGYGVPLPHRIDVVEHTAHARHKKPTKVNSARLPTTLSLCAWM
jgi:hypothetical protein